MDMTTLRPGLLVSLKTGVTGNVSYKRADIEPDHLTEAGTKQAKWETERTIDDPDEFEKAHATRSKCRGGIYKVCTQSTFGLLCPEDKKDDLDKAVEAAQILAAEFNATATITRVSVFVIVGRIAADDVQAVRAINSEVRQLLTDMEQGLRNLDVKAVRDAANKALQIGRMLSPSAADRIRGAVDAARETARRIVKAGEEAAQEVDRNTIRKITSSRTAFLDLEEGAEMQVPQAQQRAVDLEPEVINAVRPQERQPELEI